MIAAAAELGVEVEMRVDVFVRSGQSVTSGGQEVIVSTSVTRAVEVSGSSVMSGAGALVEVCRPGQSFTSGGQEVIVSMSVTRAVEVDSARMAEARRLVATVMKRILEELNLENL